MPEFFLEIGAEEIPAGYMEPALNYLGKQLTEFFQKNHLQSDGLSLMGTPRRLVASFSEVQARQEDRVETHYGPNVKAAYDSEGQPTKAAQGFARGKGVDVKDLTTEKTAKGEVVCARVEKKGQDTEHLLKEYLPQLIGSIPFPKKMRWANKKLSFARPVHWIGGMLGKKNLEFEFDGIACGNLSYGHRFLKPGSFKFKGLKDYLAQCGKSFLVVDPQERKNIIMKQVREIAKEAGGTVKEDHELLDVVNYLVEYPVAVRGDFDPRYLELPEELLVMTMKHHQKYFPVWGTDGKLMPHFITVSNMKPGKGNEIQQGNQRVLKARLEDARFFFDEDKKLQLEDYVERLKGVVFQKTLGTSYEKMTRFKALAEELAQKVCPKESNRAQRAAFLCKADLVTQMVFEFPELQGIIGGYYASHSGEDPEVALAIKEHYRPAFAGDATPANDSGAVVAIADKLDTILGCISVGLIPSGSEDPYGLRRHSLGIMQILLQRNWRVSLDELMDKGIDLLSEKAKLSPQEIRGHTIDLFSQRFKSLLDGEGFPYDAIEAVLSAGIDVFVDVRQKVEAFAELKKQPYFEPLAITFRRVVSILTEEAAGPVDSGLLKEPAEKKLYEKYLEICKPVEQLMDKRDYAGALEKIVEIKASVDDFFDHVMVNVEDEALKQNRMRLLYGISKLFSNLADFSKIVFKKS